MPMGKRADDRMPSLHTDLGMRHAGFDNSFGKQTLKTSGEVFAIVITLESDYVELSKDFRIGFFQGSFSKTSGPGMEYGERIPLGQRPQLASWRWRSA